MKTQDTFWYTRYKNQRDELKFTIDRNKKSFVRECFQKHAKNWKESRNKIKQILNNKKSGCDKIYLTENGIIITDPKQLANQLNNYFVTVAEKLLKKLVKQITNIKTILKPKWTPYIPYWNRAWWN